MVSFRQIQMVCVMYLAAWMIAPPLAYATIYRLIAVVAAGVWMLLQNYTKKTYRNKKMGNNMQRYVLCAVIYIAAVLFCQCVFKKEPIMSALYGNITTYVLLLVGYIGGVYCRDERYEELQKILSFIILLVVVFSITSIFRSDEFYYMTRNAGGTEDEAYNLLAQKAAMQGVGGFGFFAFSAAFSPMVLWYSYFRSKRKKIWLRIAFIIIEIGVLSAGYTLALLISILGIAICLFYNMRSRYGKLLVVLTCFVLLLFWDSVSKVLYVGLQNMSAGTMYANKVEDIFSFLLEGNSTGTFEARQERYLYSLQSIFRYPVLGSYILAGVNAIGSHSSILDPFAAYGWFVGMAWLYIVIVFPYKMANSSRGNGIKQIVFTTLFFTALFNRTTMIMGMFFLIVPAIESVYKS